MMDVNSNNQNEVFSDKASDETYPEKGAHSGIQLRTSARVLKKQKLDNDICSIICSDKKVEERIELKEANTNGGSGPVVVVVSSPVHGCSSGVGNSGAGVGSGTSYTTRKQPASNWSPDEKSLFFEALNEVGKDFDSIKKYMTSKAKKREGGGGGGGGGVSGITLCSKTKLQIQSFYRRMFLKISKYITLPDCVKKSTQELYMLINFGELRKRIGHLTERNALKLKELIYCGSTQVRVKGKTWRVKTPICHALRKLNQLEDCLEEVRLPQRVEATLTPRDNRDRWRVESIGHNSRIKTSLALDLPLSSLIQFLETKWAPIRHTNDEFESKEKNQMRVGPKRESTIVQTFYKCSQMVTSDCLSLLTHQAKIGAPLAHLQTLLGIAPPVGVKAGRTWAKWHPQGDLSLGNQELVEPSMMTSAENNNDDEYDAAVAAEDNCPSEADHSARRETKEEFTQRIRKGWNCDNSRRTTIADLYLMFGGNCRLEMEYWWDDEIGCEISCLSKLVSLAKIWYASQGKDDWGGVGGGAGGGCCSAVNCASSAPTQAANQQMSQPIAQPLSPPQQVEVKTEVPDESSPQRRLVVVNKLRTTTCTTSSRFRQPLLPAPLTNKRLANNPPSNDLQLKPKYCNRRGRYRPKNVVVQRMLPLLPKTSSAAPACTLVTLQVVAGGPGSPGLGEFIGPDKKLTVKSANPSDGEAAPAAGVTCCRSGGNSSSGSEAVENGATGGSVGNEIDESVVKNAVNSPLLSQETGVIFLAGEPTQNNFSGLLGGTTDVSATPPTSPSRILQEGGEQWLSSEVSDFSLSSFLGHLESPLKANGILPLEDSRMSADVDSHLHSMMMETSLDYTAKFADLAAKIADGSSTYSATPGSADPSAAAPAQSHQQSSSASDPDQVKAPI